MKQLAIIIAVLITLFAPNSLADKLRIPVIMTNPEMGAKQISELFARSPLSEKVELHFVSSLGKSQYPLAITVGEKPLAEALVTAHNTQAVIALGIDSQRFAALADKLKEKQNRVQFTAIYSDAPIERQLKLAKIILPRASRFTYLYQNLHSDELKQLKEAAKQRSLKLNIVKLKNTNHLTKLLSDAIDNSDFLLARKDPGVYNPETIRTILLTSYRRNFVVLGLSKAYVKAGVVATTYSSAEHMVQSLSEYLDYYLKTGKLPAPDYSQEFNVAVNRQVANSMDLAIPEDRELIRRIKGENHGQH